MPLCARCLGAAIGHCSALTLFAFGYLLPVTVCFAFIGILSVDWSLQKWAGIISTNSRRLITGILGGLGVGTFWWLGLRSVINWLS